MKHSGPARAFCPSILSQFQISGNQNPADSAWPVYMGFLESLVPLRAARLWPPWVCSALKAHPVAFVLSQSLQAIVQVWEHPALPCPEPRTGPGFLV